MALKPTDTALFLGNTGYYLVEIGPTGRTTSSDGQHDKRSGALQAYKLWQALGFIKEGCEYRIVQVEEMDVAKAMKQGINDKAAGQMRDILDNYGPHE